MIKPVFYIVFLILTFHLKAQENLVPNGSFEEYYSCPLYDTDFSVKFWYKPNGATTDYFNACQTVSSNPVNVPNAYFGFQMPKTGHGFVGLIPYIENYEVNAEYVQVKLNSSLVSCITYRLEFWVSLANFSSRATNTISARFDVNPIYISNPYGFELPPHVFTSDVIVDTNGWTKITGEYTAKGGEKFLTIGRFLDTAITDNTNIPNISVNCIPCFPADNYAYYYLDDVTLIQLNLSSQDAETNVLTDNDDSINDWWYPENICLDGWKCDIFNRWGNVVFTFNQGTKGWHGKSLDGSDLSEGVYFYRIYNDSNIKTGFIHLIR